MIWAASGSTLAQVLALAPPRVVSPSGAPRPAKPPSPMGEFEPETVAITYRPAGIMAQTRKRGGTAQTARPRHRRLSLRHVFHPIAVLLLFGVLTEEVDHG